MTPKINKKLFAALFTPIALVALLQPAASQSFVKPPWQSELAQIQDALSTSTLAILSISIHEETLKNFK